VSSVINPVGPEEPGVYWRRRLLVGLGVLVVLIIFFMLLRSCSSDPTPTAAPSPTPSPTATASSSPSASPSTSASGTACTDADIEVTVKPDKGTSFPSGTPITFTMAIKNISDKACTRNVGTKPNTVLVQSGGSDIWSSDDCAPAGTDQVQSIQPGDVYQLNANWNQQQSKPGCPSGQPNASPGSYEVIGKNDQVKSNPATFTIS
jgi:archaellum component FlaG (FlaF/FlaG flagellin family)